jgi:chromosome segregation protein
VGEELPPDQLIEPTRAALVALKKLSDSLAALIERLPAAQMARDRLVELNAAKRHAEDEIGVGEDAVAKLRDANTSAQLGLLTTKAKEQASLVATGRHLGLQEGRCPLCGAQHDAESFSRGLNEAEARALKWDAQALDALREKEKLDEAERVLQRARALAVSLDSQIAELTEVVDQYEKARVQLKIKEDENLEQLKNRQSRWSATLVRIESALRILESIRLNPVLTRALEAESDLKKRLVRAEARLGINRRAQSTAKALHDATRRAVGEVMDRRLERILPLMAELYQRLQPHPFWRDIEYSIRGDVKRFLSLRVGDHLNPQFIFSSGQRRATGLAFLLSINMATAWNRWSSIVLDDPVQHVDDFRTLHLAELLAQLCRADDK